MKFTRDTHWSLMCRSDPNFTHFPEIYFIVYSLLSQWATIVSLCQSSFISLNCFTNCESNFRDIMWTAKHAAQNLYTFVHEQCVCSRARRATFVTILSSFLFGYHIPFHPWPVPDRKQLPSKCVVWGYSFALKAFNAATCHPVKSLHLNLVTTKYRSI